MSCMCFIKIDKYCAVIKFFVLDGLTPKKIHPKLTKVYRNTAPSISTVKKWAAEFKRSRKLLEDDPCEGRPKTSTTLETIEKVHNIMLDDRWVKVCKIPEAMGISKERVWNFLKEELGIRKLCARWVPHFLMADHKQMAFAAMFGPIQKESDRFCHHGWDMGQPQARNRTAVEAMGGSQKAKSITSAWKVMASMFWDAKGMLLIDYLEKGRTISV